MVLAQELIEPQVTCQEICQLRASIAVTLVIDLQQVNSVSALFNLWCNIRLSVVSLSALTLLVRHGVLIPCL